MNKLLSSDWNLPDKQIIKSVLQEHYTKEYTDRREKNDSPDKSRVAIIRRIKDVLRTWIPTNMVLDIGSWPQSVEREMFMNKKKIAEILKLHNFITLDQAYIPVEALWASKKNINVTHIRWDAHQLPFWDEHFWLIYSNLAIDFCEKEAFLEAYRVLSYWWTALFNFHHPFTIPENPEKIKDNTKIFWTYVKQKWHLFDSEDSIISFLDWIGFRDIKVRLIETIDDKRWEVSAKKQ